MTTPSDDLLGPSTAADRTDGTDAEVARLRRQLLAERERSLNATDRVLGAQAEAAQARAEIRELEYRLHVREAELSQARQLLDLVDESPRSGVEQRTRAVARTMVGRGGLVARRLADRIRSGKR